MEGIAHTATQVQSIHWEEKHLKISNTSTIKITGSNIFITTETMYLFKKI